MLTLNNFVQDPNTGRLRPKPRPRRMIKLKFINDPNFHERALAEASKIEQRRTQNLPPAGQKNAWPSTSTGCSSPSISDMSGESDVTLSVQRFNPPQISSKLEKYANFANKAENLDKIYKKLDDQEHEIHNHTQEIEKLKNPGFWDGLFGNNEAEIAAKEEQIKKEEEQISNLELRKQLFSNVASILECANNQGELEEALGIYSEFIDETEQRQEEIDPNQIKLSNLDSSRQNEVIHRAIERNRTIRTRASELYEALTKTVVELVRITGVISNDGADGITYKAIVKCQKYLDTTKTVIEQEAIRKQMKKCDGQPIDPYYEVIPYQILQTHALKHVYSTIRDAYEFACMHYIPVCFSAPPMPESISTQNVQSMREVHVDEKASYLMGKDYSRDIFSRLVPGEPLNHFIRDDEHGIVAKFSLEERLEICRRYLEAIWFVNGAGLIHHDLHTGNVMLDDSGAAHVIDLGRAIYLNDLDLLKDNTSVDTLSVAPPESFGNKQNDHDMSQKTYHSTFDVYSLGLMFFSIIYGKPGEDEINKYLYGPEPYQEIEENVLYKDANGKPVNKNGLRLDPESRTELFENIETIVDKCTAECPREQLALQQLSGDIKELLKGMLNPKPENRYNAKQAENFVSEMISRANS